MITKEKQALELAKRVFEHFTRDALSLAREIIAMEATMQMGSDKTPAKLEEPITGSEIVFPTSDINPSDLGITEDAQKQQPLARERTISSEEDSLPF